ncbi:DNA-methyltransferase [Arcanobacterium canis]
MSVIRETLPLWLLLYEACQGALADCVWTDPPYGVSYVGKTKDALTIQNDGASDLDGLLDDAFATVVNITKAGAPVYIAHADTARVEFETAMRGSGIEFRENLIWEKNTIVLGHSDYHYKHEPILYGFTPGGEGRLGRGGDRWYGDNAQSTVFVFDKPARNKVHPTMKPVALIQAMLRNSCPPGGLVADVFGGSGSTLIAAVDLGMRAFLVELDPHYADVIARRYEEHTGTTPLINGEEKTFITEE